LRQSHEVPDEEKIAYVDTVIELLEMENVQSALIGGQSCLKDYDYFG
jgi:hypothetical protein